MTDQISGPSRRPASPSNRQRNWIFAASAAVLILVAFFIGRQTVSRGLAVKDSPPSEAPKLTDSVVTLDSAAQRLAGIEVVTVSQQMQGELSVSGAITFDAERVSVIAPRAEGRMLRMMADLGDRVAAGQVVATVESPEIGQIRGDLDRARAATDVAKRNYEREKRLYEQNISPQKEMLDAEGLYRTAEADIRSAQSKLQTYGATTGEGGSYGLTSVVSGTVVERNGSPGQIVGPTTNVYTVADLRHVWITVDVYEADFKRVRPDAPVTLTPVAFPGESFAGRVRAMGGVVDTSSHTFKVRVHVENPQERLRPGMFAQVRIKTPSVAAAIGAVSVPDLAVQELEGKSVVFVATSVPGRFQVRAVVVGSRTGTGELVITKGLSPGERVVVKGAFQLKAELTKATLGDGA